MKSDQALARITEIKKEIYKLRDEAQAVADEHQLTFELSIEYGMGGTYYPKKKVKMSEDEALEKLKSNKPLTDEERLEIANTLDKAKSESWYDSREGWYSSSNGC